MDNSIANTLANEARRQELRAKVAKLQGTAEAQASQAQALSQSNGDTIRRLQSAMAELSALETGAGPGVTDSFGAFSSVDQFLQKEREAAKSAAVDYIKENPSCSEEDAVKVWDDAALASHPGVPVVAQPGAAMSMIYRMNLIKAGQIVGTDWEAHRGWIVVTDKSKIMGA